MSFSVEFKIQRQAQDMWSGKNWGFFALKTRFLLKNLSTKAFSGVKWESSSFSSSISFFESCWMSSFHHEITARRLSSCSSLNSVFLLSSSLRSSFLSEESDSFASFSRSFFMTSDCIQKLFPIFFASSSSKIPGFFESSSLRVLKSIFIDYTKRYIYEKHMSFYTTVNIFWEL